MTSPSDLPKDLSVIIFDVETTGTDKLKDQVIELCVQFGLGPEARRQTWRYLPSVPIHPAAEKVHGISMEDLKGCPAFREGAEEIRGLIEGADVLVGYNLRFDIEMLQAEYKRIGSAPLAIDQKLIVDPFRLWQQCEPRSLMDAHRRFVGEEFDDAHSADADVAATGRVLMGMLSSFGLEPNWNKVADVCEPNRRLYIGASHHLRWSEEGEVVMGFGKHAGVSLSELVSGGNAGYLRWILNKDFPQHVLEICEGALDMKPAEFQEWMLHSYPPPAPPSPVEEAATEEAPASTDSAPTPATEAKPAKAGQLSLLDL